MEIVTVRGRDTQIRLYIPSGRKTPMRHNRSAARGYQGGTERILIVDDDEDMEAANALSSLGIHGLRVHDPQQALQMLRVLMPDIGRPADHRDDRMPGMNGTELAEQARQSYPELPAFISGSLGRLQHSPAWPFGESYC